MYQAELKGKLPPPARRSEDVLTSNVFLAIQAELYVQAMNHQRRLRLGPGPGPHIHTPQTKGGL